MSEAQHHRLALPQGTRIRDFEFHRVLGHGGFGITYLGWNLALDIPVAIKEYLPADLATREPDGSVVPQTSQAASDFQWGLERFLDEARTLARFQHPNIVRVHHFFEAHSTAYIAMDYVEGETLSAHIERKGTLNEAELKAILYPLLSALEVVHGADFLHRDIKPGNIVLRAADGSPVLLDFGAARQAVGAKSRSVTSIVTPGYAPIEQYSSRGRQGPWTDIYALGGVCYRALTGDVPEDATDRVRDDPLVPVAQRCAGRASEAFLSAVDWALSVDEGDRPQSVGAWRAAMEGETAGAEQEEVVDAPSMGQDPPPLDRPKKSRFKRLVGALGVVALLVGGIMYVEYAEQVALEQQRREQAALEKQRQEQAEEEQQRREQAALEKQRQERAALEKQRQEQAALEKQRREQAALEKQRREQAALEKQRREQAALEKQRREQAALEQQRREQAALEKQRQEQAALEKQRREQAAFVAKVGRKPHPKGMLSGGRTDLHIAAGLNLPVLTQSLLTQGADVNAKSKDGWTPLHSAARQAAAAAAKVLLEHGADIDAKNNYGWTPLHWAGRQDAATTAAVLLEHGADVDAKNNYGWTPLHWAGRQDAATTAAVLLEHGADVNAKSKDGWTPLHWAGRQDAAAAAKVLLEHGADVDAKNNEGATPLHGAAREDAATTAAVLLEHGADVNAKNKWGATPLHNVPAWNNASATAAVLRRYGGRK